MNSLLPFVVYSKGNPRQLTESPTFFESLSLPSPGTYSIRARVQIDLDDAASGTIDKIRVRLAGRTGFIESSEVEITVTALSYETRTLANIELPEVFYSVGGPEVIQIWAEISRLPLYGRIVISASSITVLRIDK